MGSAFPLYINTTLPVTGTPYLVRPRNRGHADTLREKATRELARS